MNILVNTSNFEADGFPDQANVIYNPYKRKLSEDELIELIKQYQPVGMIAGVEPITDRALNAAHNLRAISRCGVGLDSVDVESVRMHDIKLTITPEAPTASVAELTLALMLACLRRIPQLDETIRKGGWKGKGGNLLSGKRVGIVGCGRIGAYVARLARAFGAQTIGYDPYCPIHEQITMLSLDELLSTCDIVSLHIPYTAANHHIIGEEQLCIMKPTSCLINVARGGLVDDCALCAALKSGQIACAALDCFENEPYTGELTTLNNVILSPHMGSSAKESRSAMEKEAVKNLINALNAADNRS